MSLRAEQWAGCYDGGWAGLITAESFGHPAKAARGLLVRIFDELFAMGALERGDLICDPFGGVGTTGIEAASRGCRFVGCELEPRFALLARENFALHAATWAAMGRPQPVMVQGDSRRLRACIGPALAECVVSSPPFQGSCGSTDVKFRTEGLASGAGKWAQNRSPESIARLTADYGTTPGQLGAMKAGDVAAVVSSPPFPQPYVGGGGINVKGYGKDGADKVGSRTYQGRGGEREVGNLETLPEGAVADALVSSPPWGAQAEGGLRAAKFKDPAAFAVAMSARDGHGTRNATTPASRLRQIERDAAKVYGDSDGQLGVEAGETFWSAAAEIVRESHAILREGGMAVWIVKSFVRNKAIVDFPGDWRRLCEACGFETVKEVHAMLVAEERVPHLWDGEKVTKRERKSFFRRLAESKGSPPIDFETVLFMVKR